MRHFLPVCLAVLALAGCDRASSISITRNNSNGVDLLYSKITVIDGVANLQCIASRSGQCHYLLLDPRCRPDSDCDQPVLRQQAVAVGHSEPLRGLPPGFQHCVSETRKEQCHRE